jgi:hypothetical protein
MKKRIKSLFIILLAVVLTLSSCDQLLGGDQSQLVEYLQSQIDSLEKVYYTGSAKEWNRISISISNNYLKSATRYYYSETEPVEAGNYWYWVDGEVKIWD